MKKTNDPENDDDEMRRRRTKTARNGRKAPPEGMV
jgi:hypothetical protein